jgi:hypothetical protein
VTGPSVMAPTGAVAGLLLPVDGPAQVTVIAAEAAPGSWRWHPLWGDTVDGGHPVVWCGERRNVVDLPANGAAWVLAARLGCPELADRIGLNGDLLLAGIGPDRQMCDVPIRVVHAAQRAGLLDPSVHVPLDTDGGAEVGVVSARRE